ncbi:MAG: PhzF family phenazine biosynthesis protein [Chloroflexi bacterium OLB14]|nr:MAG: PhzF family phenazine biosynthesis protein [Chloroflexi bacterium OLB14]
MSVLKLAAFSHNGQGGNPAGVVFYDAFPSAEEMMSIAKEVGYSETAFLVKQNDGWRVRYFAPELEVPFCGHATIALGAALGEKFGENVYKLFLNNSEISVRAEKSGEHKLFITLQSPSTSSTDAPKEYVDKILKAFNLKQDDLNPAFPIKFASAGAKHLIIFVKNRKTLADMNYEFELVKTLMAENGLVTISILWQESDSIFHSRNPFPSGGVYEDPATGAAAAALAGYLRDINWNVTNEFTILQGEDMGMPSRLNVKFTQTKGESVSISGEVRHMTE